MQRLEVSGAVRPIYGSLGVKRLRGWVLRFWQQCHWIPRSFGMWRCVTGQVIADVSKEPAAFSLKCWGPWRTGSCLLGVVWTRFAPFSVAGWSSKKSQFQSSEFSSIRLRFSVLGYSRDFILKLWAPPPSERMIVRFNPYRTNVENRMSS